MFFLSTTMQRSQIYLRALLFKSSDVVAICNLIIRTCPQCSGNAIDFIGSNVSSQNLTSFMVSQWWQNLTICVVSYRWQNSRYHTVISGHSFSHSTYRDMYDKSWFVSYDLCKGKKYTDSVLLFQTEHPRLLLFIVLLCLDESCVETIQVL